jgi:hypothetical protein
VGFSARVNVTDLGRMTVVYRLFLKDEVVYVGQATCVPARVLAHANEGKKEFDSYDFVEVSPDDLNEAEARVMCAHRPRYNCNVPCNSRFLAPAKIAHLTGKHPATVWRAIEKAQITGFLGLYDINAVKALFDEQAA